MIYYRYNEDFRYIGNTETEPDNEHWSLIAPNNFFIPTFNGVEWFEGANLQELEDFRKSQVPNDVALWQIMATLNMMGFEQTILTALQGLPEPTKSVVERFMKHGTIVERNSNTIGMIQQVINYTDSQMDDLFIQAKNIEL